MNSIFNALRDPLRKIAAFNPPLDYGALAEDSFSRGARVLAEDLREVLPEVLALANRLAAMLRDLEGPIASAPRVILNENNTIVFEQGYTSDLGLEVAIYRSEVPKSNSLED